MSYLEKGWDLASWAIFFTCPKRQLSSCKHIKYPVLHLFLLQQDLNVSSKLAFLVDSIFKLVSDKPSCEELFTNSLKLPKKAEIEGEMMSSLWPSGEVYILQVKSRIGAAAKMLCCSDV